MGRGGAGLQSEVLDDATTRSLFVDVDPQEGDARGRKFSMSFDVRQYDPAEVAVRCDEGSLVVEAKHLEHDGSGAKVAREFQRRIQLPRDVDPVKLTSTLSTDGILTVEAPVPPGYQAVVGPSVDVRAQNGSGRMLGTSAVQSRASPVQARVSPVTVRLEPTAGTAGRSRSPFLEGVGSIGGRQSPYFSGAAGPNGRPLSGNGSIFPLPVNSGLRNSPVPFTSLAPLTALTPNTPVPGQIDFPVIKTDPATGERRMEVLLELGRPYTAEDVVVKVDGRRLTVDARHETKDQQRGVTTSTTQKQFDIDGELDADTVHATLRDDGRMVIAGCIKQ